MRMTFFPVAALAASFLVQPATDPRMSVPIKRTPTATPVIAPPPDKTKDLEAQVASLKKLNDSLTADLATANALAAKATARIAELESQAGTAQAEVARLTTSNRELQSKVTPVLPTPAAYGATSTLPLTDANTGVRRRDPIKAGETWPEKNDVVGVIYHEVTDGKDLPAGARDPQPVQTVGLFVYMNDDFVFIAQSNVISNGTPSWGNLVSIPIGVVDDIFVLSRAKNIPFPPGAAPVIGAPKLPDPRFTAPPK